MVVSRGSLTYVIGAGALILAGAPLAGAVAGGVVGADLLGNALKSVPREWARALSLSAWREACRVMEKPGPLNHDLQRSLSTSAA